MQLTKESVLSLEEAALEKAKGDSWRLRFHLMPISGWLNDPNGLSEVEGTNHIFFQYTPQDTKSTTTNCWGHYTTKDFINYIYFLPSLYPDTIYEVNGVYSGSAINTSSGIRAYYTGNVKCEGDYDYINRGREQNTLLADSYNEKTGEFESKTLLMKNEDYPKDMSLHVRDPKVIKKDDKFYMLLGARTKSGIGSLIIYESEDGINWKEKDIIYGNPILGYMWECPDGITINEKDFLIFSPQGIEAEGDRFQNTFQSGYLRITNDHGEISCKEFLELDHGFDFYAPQTYTDEDGRVILIAWMGLSKADYDYPTTKNQWIHALTIPRELSEHEGKLIQTPIKELEKLRVSYETLELDGSNTIIQTPEIYEIVLKDPSTFGKMIINNSCILSWNSDTFTLSFESENKAIKKAGAGRTHRKTRISKIQDLRIFVDTSSIEIFINNGEEVFTTRYFPEDIKQLECIDFIGNLTIFNLRSFNYERPDGTVLFDF